MGLADAQQVADRTLRAWVHRGRAVGVVLGLIRGDEIGVKAFGSSGTARPLGPDTLMEIGSITKTFTGLLLAEMSLRGEVGLEDPIRGHLPFVPPRGRGREITLLDLATHTSQLPRSGRRLIGQQLRNRTEPFAAFTEEDLFATVEAARIRGALGSRLSYSNIGFGLLGVILARAAGRPYGELIAERICRPLGLVDTVAEVDEARLGRLARGHRRGGRPAPPLRIPALAGAGVLRSTALDMVTYLRAHPVSAGHLAARGGPAACGPTPNVPPWEAGHRSGLAPRPAGGGNPRLAQRRHRGVRILHGLRPRA